MPSNRTAQATASSRKLGVSADCQLVTAVLARDRKATAAFVADYADPVHAYITRRLAPRTDLVDDLVQEIFLAALDNLGSYRGVSSLRSWLLGIARHKVEDYYRSQLRRPMSLDDDTQLTREPTADEPSAEEMLDRVADERRTQRVLQRLPEPYALVLLWRYWENRSVRQIAEATDRTEKAVERLLARARVRFRALWGTLR